MIKGIRIMYVNNAEFYTILCDYLKEVQDAKDNNLPIPKPNDVIGLNIINICNKIMNRWNFQSYTWRDEMTAVAIVDCVAAIRKFDPTISKSPFAFFSQIAYYAAVRVITNEKKQNDIKYSLEMQNYTLDPNDEDMDTVPLDRVYESFVNARSTYSE
jgi:hypothetical protein